MADRNAQAQAVSAALGDWLAKAQAFDQANAADIAAQAASNAAFRAYNDVAWMTQEHSGATPQQKIDAEQKEIAKDEARAAYDRAFQVTAAASKQLNDARAALRGAVDALDQTGAVENTGGTILGGPTV